MVPKIALVGRTNVGKSTLFNRLLETQKALVSDIAGTTRDRHEGFCIWRGKVITIVDTGGLDIPQSDEIEINTLKQAELAIKLADIILFVVDIKDGLLPQDKELAHRLSKSKKPIFVVANKAEKPSDFNQIESPEWRLGGLGRTTAISALRGTGVGDLLDKIYDKLYEIGKEPAPISKVHATHVAVIGKPNVGKSSIINAIIGEERFITTPISHTTREPNDVMVDINDKSYVFIDTAGMRKKGKVKKTGGLEQAGVRKTERILKKTDVALFVLDINEPLGNQEKTLAGTIKNSRVGIIIVANKWDLIEDKNTNTMNQYKKYISASIPFLSWAPVIFVSAKNQQRIPKIFELIDQVNEKRFTSISENELDEFWRKAVVRHKPSRGKGPKPPKVLGMKQTGTAPPTFDLIIKAKRLDILHPSYLRYLENQLRNEFDFKGTPIVINVKAAQAVGK